MKTLYLERSVSTGRDGGWTEKLDLDGIERIVVGTGPGSFAGIRAAIAFAQGFALGRNCEVLGLPSPCAIAATTFATHGIIPLAVVGDARQGKRWVARFDDGKLSGEVFQVTQAELARIIAPEIRIVSPDDRRIGAELHEIFNERYLGEVLPTDAGLAAYAEAHPQALKPEPLPIYLNPAVR